MSNIRVNFHRIFNVLICLSIIISAICLITGCILIYSSGEQPYSRETVANTFSAISAPIYICLILTVFGFILNLCLPSGIERSNPNTDYKNVLNRLIEKKDLSKCDESILNVIYFERKKRKLNSLILTVVVCISAAIFLIHALNLNNYQSEINESIIKAMWVLIPCLAATFICGLFTAYHNEKSFRREIEAVKRITEKNVDKSTAQSSNRENKHMKIVRCVLLLLGIGIFIYGYVSGGTSDVLTKAVNICTECIGLG